MNWRVKTLVLPLCTAALTVLATDSEAAVSVCGAASCTETEIFDLLHGVSSVASTPSDSATLDFDLFNGALGTLDSVAVSIASNIIITLSIEGAEGAFGLSDHSTRVSSVALGANNELFSESLFDDCIDNVVGCTGGDDNLPGIDASGDLLSLLGLGAPVVANFVGPGLFSINLEAIAAIDECNANGTLDGGEFCEATTGWDGSITVDYTFTSDTTPPRDVPEPATLGLFALGLAGVGYLNRRRRKTGGDAADRS